MNSLRQEPGKFKLWALLGGQLLNIKLQVPRTMYLNYTTEPEDGTLGTRVNKVLPHSHPAMYLYQVETTEESFQSQGKGGLISEFASRGIEGIYETRYVQKGRRERERERMKKRRRKKEPLPAFQSLGNLFHLLSLSRSKQNSSRPACRTRDWVHHTTLR